MSKDQCNTRYSPILMRHHQRMETVLQLLMPGEGVDAKMEIDQDGGQETRNTDEVRIWIVGPVERTGPQVSFVKEQFTPVGRICGNPPLPPTSRVPNHPFITHSKYQIVLCSLCFVDHK